MIRRFNRFELKFIISRGLRDAVREDLLANMTLDAHGDGDGFYRVTSLYYDSPDHGCFRAKVDGIKYRRKLRVRIYGGHAEDESGVAMAEIKQRINRTVQKRRLSLQLGPAYALCAGQPLASVTDVEDRAVASEIGFLVRSRQLRPACVITYRRQAFVGSRYEAGLRITFDQMLGVRGPEHRLGPGTPTHAFMNPDRIIMEVKVNDAVPLWVARLMARHNCRLRRISKYCTGLARLQSLAREVERARGEEWTSC
jgi:SPX domain protein involved in polyphosphate accumulation